MTHLALITLLLSSTTSFALLCISTEKPIQESLDTFDIDAFEKQFASLRTFDIGDGICHVQIIISYHQRSLTLSFTQHIQNRTLNAEQINFQTVLQIADAKYASLVNTFEYACDKDECEKRFLIHIIDWLSKFNYIELQTSIMSAIPVDITQSGEWCDVLF